MIACMRYAFIFFYDFISSVVSCSCGVSYDWRVYLLVKRSLPLFLHVHMTSHKIHIHWLTKPMLHGHVNIEKDTSRGHMINS